MLGRVRERERQKKSESKNEKEIGLPFTGSFTKWSQWPVLIPATKARRKSFFWVSQVSGSGPKPYIIFCCCPRPLIGNWIGSESALILTGVHVGC